MEYRIEELARTANTTVRNIRAYRDRGLVAAPRREGRIAVYDDSHLNRLRLIANLLARGYNLTNIAELLAAWERGGDVSEVLGLESALVGPWSDERPVEMTRAELDTMLDGPLPDDVIDAGIDTGLLVRVGEPGGADERYLVTSRRQLLAGRRLVEAGIPIDAVIATLRSVHDAIDLIAQQFVELVTVHLFDPLGGLPTAEDVPRLAEVVESLRPVASDVVRAELARNMEQHVQEQVAERVLRMGDPSEDQRSG